MRWEDRPYLRGEIAADEMRRRAARAVRLARFAGDPARAAALHAIARQLTLTADRAERADRQPRLRPTEGHPAA